ncbi:MAG: Flp pilus assembly complex ATPase component TadA, partial [Armatimonadetes bacterium]|nr:Flp pilus assembly complex ATPase component TadA [Armatimonadota bacterium]
MAKQTILSDLRCDLRSFALMIETGLSLVRMLYVLEESGLNPELRSAIKEVRADVESGGTLSKAMAKHEAVFPPLLVRLVRAGEVGGILDVTLNRAADYADHEALITRFVDNAEAYRTFQLSLWSFEMGCMLTSGVPILQALETVAENCEPQALREATLFMHTSIREGDRLSTVMEQYPEVFPPLVRHILTIGEEHGKLDNLCLRLADHLEQMAEEILQRGEAEATEEREFDSCPAGRRPTVSQQGTEVLRAEKELSPIVVKVNEILQQAAELGATDIHIQTARRTVRVRFRVEGALRPGPEIALQDYWAVASRLKVMAGLDIGERRLPQRGRLSCQFNERDYDMRVATFPTTHGEAVYIHVRQEAEGVVALQHLGWEGDQEEQVHSLLKQPCGIIVVAGPQGSGRTTTLCSLLEHLNSVERSLVTIEESLGREIPGVQQAISNRALDLTPATMLRSLLSQDPDILMVDEVRDGDTLRQAIDAALAGHLLLVGLAGHDAATAVEKLVALASEPALLADALVAVVAQRLVRKI